MLNKQRTIVLSTIAIATVAILFALGPIVGNQQVFANYGYHHHHYHYHHHRYGGGGMGGGYGGGGMGGEATAVAAWAAATAVAATQLQTLEQLNIKKSIQSIFLFFMNLSI